MPSPEVKESPKPITSRSRGATVTLACEPSGAFRVTVTWPATDLGSLGSDGTTRRSSRQSPETVVGPAWRARCVAVTNCRGSVALAGTAPAKLHWQDCPAAASGSKTRTIHPGART